MPAEGLHAACPLQRPHQLRPRPQAHNHTPARLLRGLHGPHRHGHGPRPPPDLPGGVLSTAFLTAPGEASGNGAARLGQQQDLVPGTHQGVAGPSPLACLTHRRILLQPASHCDSSAISRCSLSLVAPRKPSNSTVVIRWC